MTPHAAPTQAPSERFQRLEDPGTDFPFYKGEPVPLSGGQWLLLMVAVAAGFAMLVLPVAWPGGAFGVLIPALLFPALPLVALARIAPVHWRVLFGHVRGRELRLMVGFALLNLVVSMGVGILVSAVAGVSSNAAMSELATMDTRGQVLFFIKTLPQLFGEEVLTLLPFLALMALLTGRFGVGRRKAIVGAWLRSALCFDLVHLPTYGWNWVQCIFIIGTARLVLTLPWILTKNIWVSTGAHIVNDWLLFSLGLLGAGLAARA